MNDPEQTQPEYGGYPPPRAPYQAQSGYGDQPSGAYPAQPGYSSYPSGAYPAQPGYGDYPSGSYPAQSGYRDYPSGSYPAQPAANYPGYGMGQWEPPPRRGISTGAVVAGIAIAVAVSAVIGTVVYLGRDEPDNTADGPRPSASQTTQPVQTPSTQPTGPRTQYWVDTFEDAPGYSTPGGTQTGTLYEGTHYVYCKVWGPSVGRSPTVYNHWWLLTDLDVGSPTTNQYVSAYYLSRWGNDEARDNDGVDIPDC